MGENPTERVAEVIILDRDDCEVREEWGWAAGNKGTKRYDQITWGHTEETAREVIARLEGHRYRTARLLRRLVITTAAEDITGEASR